MRPFDQQAEVLDAIEARLPQPSLTTEELGRIVITIERFVESARISQAAADAPLADRMYQP